MTDPGRLVRRGWCALLFGIQVLAGAVPLADARLETAPFAGLHIEERGEHPCTALHDHVHCALCQHLTHRDAMLAAGPAGFGSLGQDAATWRRAPDADVPPAHARPHGRSPPTV